MAVPTEHNPKLDKLFDSLLPQGSLGRVNSIKADKCSWCGKDSTDFRDSLSRKEYTISGMCQSCQDKTFR
jgi:NaMN:DMB phosphoribosyltransferase